MANERRVFGPVEYMYSDLAAAGSSALITGIPDGFQEVYFGYEYFDDAGGSLTTDEEIMGNEVAATAGTQDANVKSHLNGETDFTDSYDAATPSQDPSNAIAPKSVRTQAWGSPAGFTHYRIVARMVRFRGNAVGGDV